MDFIYYIFKDFIHYLAILLILLAILVVVVGIARPHMVSKRIKLFSSRKYTAIGSLTSIILLFGVVNLTGPTTIERMNINKQSDDTATAKDKPTQQEVKAGEQAKVEKKLVKKIRPIDFETKRQTDKNLPAGKEKIVQKGEAGKMLVTYEVDYLNGKEVSRQLKSQSVMERPVAQITLVGSDKSETSKKDHCHLFFGSLNSSNHKSKSCSIFD